MKRFLLATLFLLPSFLVAHALDLLLPRPQVIETQTVDHVTFEHVLAKIPERLRDQAYRITFTAEGTPTIEAASEQARYYAEATLRQIKSFGGAQSCVIVDWPRLPVRGILLDTGRNYMEPALIKELLHRMSDYKYNLFHWHITDNHGWRLESKKYPQLTKAASMDRFPGKFYTQKEFKEIVALAKKLGITVMPELDVPGHTVAFRKAFGLSKMNEPQVRQIVTDLIEELCTLAPAEVMPYVHLGTDEVQAHERVPHDWVEGWVATVISQGRTCVGWAPGIFTKTPGKKIKQLWQGATDPRGDATPYFDSQNSYYINHVDPFELLSVAAYQQPCRWGKEEEKAGAIFAVWHDDRARNGEDVIRMNAVYPALVLLSDNLWLGRDQDEPTLYARLPAPDDPRFNLAQDLERRAIVHRDLPIFKKVPFPFLAQTEQRWHMTLDGSPIDRMIAQATIYPRHFWFPKARYVDKDNGTVVLESEVWSPRAQTLNAWIGCCGWSRSDGRSRDGKTPALGQWNKHGAQVFINGQPINPPKWKQPNMGGGATREIPLVDEDYFYRDPLKVAVKQGWNTVKVVLPKQGGWKWIGTFALFDARSTSDHPQEAKGLKYRIPESYEKQ